MDRKLAAILAADVVGYSAQMERDEAGTFARVVAGRAELFDPLVQRHHGRIFKAMGDGFLAEFGSVVQAVECAVAIQRALAERNGSVPEEERLYLRVGINLGEVIVEGDDRYGEGVNIATRLEQLAEPGGILVSGKVAKEVEKKLAFGFEPLGEQKVKNIDEPVPVYRIRLDGIPVPRKAPAGARPVALLIAAALVVLGLVGTGAWYLLRTPEAAAPGPMAGAEGRPALVVLPFASLSDDQAQGYLADGITDDLTTELARVPGLFVISRNAAFTYKGKSVAPAQIAKDLGVRYILEGSTRRAGDEMRINAQLVDAQSGGNVWAERFEGRWADVFKLQDQVVANVADALKLRLVTQGQRKNIAGGTDNTEAYDLYLRGTDLQWRANPDDVRQMVDHFEGALRLDPDFGAAAAALATAYWDVDDHARQLLGVSWDDVESRLQDYLAKAALHPSPGYYQLNGQMLVRQNRSDEAIAGLQKALVMDPSDFATFEGLSQAYTFNGQPAEGRAYLDAAMRLDPTWNDWRYLLAAQAAFGEGKLQEAADLLEKIDVKAPSPWPKFYGYQMLVSIYGHLGKKEELEKAKATLQTLLDERGEGPYDQLRTQHFFVYKQEADIMRLLDGLSKAGIPQLPFGFDPKSADRLTNDQIKEVFFGHELKGRYTFPRIEDYRMVTAPDGTFELARGKSTAKGITWAQGNFKCNAYPDLLTHCGAVFRNPRGSKERLNEYNFVNRRDRGEFSQVK